MTSHSISAIPIGMPRLLGGTPLRAFGNLLAKELRESRGALIAGLVIFWLMPALWEGIYILVDPHHELLAGFAWILVGGAGWLYAVVIGANTVCRDWGRGEERFLAAQPVDPRAVVWAKLIAGVVTAALPILLALGWDYLVLLTACSRNQSDLLLGLLVSFMGMGIGCAGAFACSVVTRQTLASILLAVLTLIVWLVAPLLSGRLAWLHPSWDAIFIRGQRPDFTFLAIIPLVFVGCVGVALATSRREITIRLGNKQLAWTVALVVVALSLMALREVGNSLHICDQEKLWSPVARMPERAAIGIRVSHQESRFYVVGETAWADTKDYDVASDRPVAAFRIDERGQITDVRRGELPSPNRLWQQESKSGQKRVGPQGLMMNQAGQLVLSGWRIVPAQVRREERPYHRRIGLWQVRYAWPDDGPPVVVSKAELPLPEDPEPNAVLMGSCSCTDRFAYLLYTVRAPDQARGSQPTSGRYQQDRAFLLVMDWSDGLAAKPRYRIDLPAMVSYTRIVDGRLKAHGVWQQGWFLAGSFDADHPESVGTSPPGTAHAFRWYSRPELENALLSVARPYGGARTCVFGSDLACVRDNLGLRVFRTKVGEKLLTPELLGECRDSPLAMFASGGGGSYGPPWLIDDSLFITAGRSGLFGSTLDVYDGSDPRHPRRAGFHHQSTAGWGPGSSPVIIATDRYLVLFQDIYGRSGLENCLVTVLDRPKPVRPGSRTGRRAGSS